MPVLNCASTFASAHGSRSYSSLVCLPGNAAPTLLECTPTFSGRLLVGPRLARAALSIVDLIPGRCVGGRAFDPVAFCALSLAIFFHLLSSCAGVHITVTVLPSLRKRRMEL